MAQLKRLSPKQVLSQHLMALALFAFTLVFIQLHDSYAAFFTGAATLGIAVNIFRRII